MKERNGWSNTDWDMGHFVGYFRISYRSDIFIYSVPPPQYRYDVLVASSNSAITNNQYTNVQMYLSLTYIYIS